MQPWRGGSSAPLLLQVAEAAERAANVREEVGAQEGPAEAELDRGAERDVAERAGEALGLQQQQQQARCREEDVGLDGDAKGVERAAELPVASEEGEHGEPEAEHRPTVVEQSQHVDGVQAQRGAHEEQRPRRQPARPRDGVACDGGAERRHVARGHRKLRRQDVGAVVRQPPDGTVQVDKAARIDKRTGLAAQQRVVVDAVHERPLDLLHVRLEVDRRVADHLDDQQAEDELAEENQWDQRNSRVP